MNDRPIRPERTFVLYWMTSARRLRWNFGLDRAVEHALALRKPLLILEALRCDYPHASDRLHQFILDGMRDNRRAAAKSRARYYPYVEPKRGHGKKLLETLARGTCLVVTDWSPAFFLPRMTEAAARKVDVRLEAVDSNGLIPIASHGRAFKTAHSYRAFVQRVLREHIVNVPDEAPLTRLRRLPRLTSLPLAITRCWPAATDRLLAGGPRTLAALPIDHSVPPAPWRGGSTASDRLLRRFIQSKLALYGERRNHPDDDVTSRMSPYLHFGHISAHEIFSAVMTHERAPAARASANARARARGGGAPRALIKADGVSASAEAFLDQLVVWRELAFNTSAYTRDYATYESLPEWARKTLAQHGRDRRPHRYSFDRLEAARTDDEIWNAAQRQLVEEGWFYGYLRMLWGKKILEWSPDAAQALTRMQALMDRYSLDGRDPNSYAGYAWVLGRYDRPWPERPVFGTVRYMSSASTRRKLQMRQFLSKYTTPA